MDRLVLALALAAVAVVVALLLRRRAPEPPTQGGYQVPTQLDRRDFDRPDAPWLVVVFTSETCQSCEKAIQKAAVLASDDVVVQDVSWQRRKDLHERYRIEAAPTIVVADEDGVVKAAFAGTPSATDLWAAVAEVREPGSSPEPHLGNPSTTPPQ